MSKFQRLSMKNKQKMWYSNLDKEVTKYALDEFSNKIPYTDMSGNPIYDAEGNPMYVEDGTKLVYSEPIPFKANIASELNELHARSYGVDQSSIYSEICIEKGRYPIKIGTLIWKNTEPIINDDGVVDEKSADYTVMGDMTEPLSADWYLLQRNNK